VNAFYYANKRHGLRPEAREMQCKVFHALSIPEYASALELFRRTFKEKKHGYKATIVSYVPETSFYNKQGLLSSRMCDLSNTEKGILDCVFLPKNYGDNPPYNCKNLNLDDKYLVDLVSAKRPTKGDWEVHLTLELVELTSLAYCP
jgi:hypothetical protein